MVGTNVWPGYEPLYLARELKYYGEREIRLVEYSSATQVMRGFRNQTIDVAALTLDEALVLREKGLDVCVILVADISEGADVILAVPPLQTLAELKGKRVAVEHTALGAYMLARALQKGGLQIQDITVVAREVDEHEDVIARKKADAVVTFEPVRGRLLQRGLMEIFSSRQIPGEIVDVLVVRRSLLETRADSLQALLEGWFKALSYMQTNPDGASKRIAPRMQMKPAEVVAAYSGLKLPGYRENRAFLGTESPGVDAASTRLAEVMVKLDLLEPSTPADRMGTARVLDRLSPESQSVSSVHFGR